MDTTFSAVVPKRGSRPRDPVERFWEHVTTGADDECWLWNHGRNPDEHGRFFDGEKLVGAHVFAARLAFGPSKPGQQTLHRCDVRGCVNWHHLFYGTQLDNIHDAMTKGRLRIVAENLDVSHVGGERNPNAKLTDEQAVEAMVLYLGGLSSHAVAQRFGVSSSLIRWIGRGQCRPYAIAEARKRLGHVD